MCLLLSYHQFRLDSFLSRSSNSAPSNFFPSFPSTFVNVMLPVVGVTITGFVFFFCYIIFIFKLNFCCIWNFCTCFYPISNLRFNLQVEFFLPFNLEKSFTAAVTFCPSTATSTTLSSTTTPSIFTTGFP